MIFTIIVWLYITFISYSIGSGLHRILRLSNVHFSLTCISGLVVLGFLSTFLCLFTPLAALTSLSMLMLAVLSWVVYGKSIRLGLKKDWPLFENRFIIVAFCLYVIAISYFSYVPSTHHDDGLYYSTSIRWLQEYGTVKGLCNVNARIGFNSAWLILQAALGFQFLHAGLFNDLSGLLYLYLLIYFLNGVGALLKKDYSPPALLRALFFIGLLTLYTGAGSQILLYNVNQLSSGSADLPVCMMTWLIFLLFVERRTLPAEGFHRKDLLILFYSMFLITMKVSAVPILLLSGFVLLQLSRRNGMKKALLAAGVCILLLAPWFIRNVMVSGYLVFPFSGVDIFNVDWKIPLENVRYHENVIKVFAIDPQADLSRPFNASLREWVPAWFLRLAFIQQVIFSLTILISLVFCGTGLTALVRRDYSFLGRNERYIVFILTAVAGTLFWLEKGPDFRFGYGFMGVYCSLGLALFLDVVVRNRKRLIAPVIIVLCYAVLPNYADEFKYMIRDLFKLPLQPPQPLEIVKVPLNEGVIMNVVTHDDCWNGPLPIALSNEFDYVRPVLRGHTIREGFKASVQTH